MVSYGGAGRHLFSITYRQYYWLMRVSLPRCSTFLGVLLRQRCKTRLKKNRTDHSAAWNHRGNGTLRDRWAYKVRNHLLQCPSHGIDIQNMECRPPWLFRCRPRLAVNGLIRNRAGLQTIWHCHGLRRTWQSRSQREVQRQSYASWPRSSDLTRPFGLDRPRHTCHCFGPTQDVMAEEAPMYHPPGSWNIICSRSLQTYL